VYPYHQHCYEVRERRRQREREAESERLKREYRAQRRLRRRTDLAAVIAYTRRATGLKLDT
jgi:hypothetical protein